MGPLLPRISRRRALAWLAGMVAAGSAAGAALRYAWTGVGGIVAFNPTPGGYGTDPDLINSPSPWARIMTAPQKSAVAALADLILPAGDGAPAPSAIGIADFIDEWVSAPYPEQQADRGTLIDGLTRLGGEATRRWGRGFAEVDAASQRQLLGEIVPSAGRPLLDDGGAFFRRLRYLVVGAYYSTRQGFADIGYVGNVALDAYPAPTPAETAILDEELRKLGL